MEGEIEQAIWRECERLALEMNDTIIPEANTMGQFLEALELALEAGKRESFAAGYLLEKSGFHQPEQAVDFWLCTWSHLNHTQKRPNPASKK